MIGALLVTIAYAVLVLFPSHLNHDVSWIVYSAREMLNGKQFGLDVIDVNPPLAWWLTMPPVFIAKTLSASPILIFRFYVLVLVGISVFLLQRTNKQLAYWQLAAVAMIMIVMPGYEFGQREHLMVIFVVPYLANIIPAEKNAPVLTRVIIGLLAGIGICLKPYFLLIPICVEIYRIAKTRNPFGIFRFETVTMFIVGLLYVAAVWIFSPAFFTEILPLALSGYADYSNPFSLVAITLISKSIAGFMVIVVLVFVGTRWRVGSGFLAAALGAALSVLLQSKGWDYHIFPVMAFLLLAVCLSAQPTKYTAIHLAALILFCLALAPNPIRQAVQLVSPAGQHNLVNTLTKRFSQLPVDQRKVFAFITSPRVIWPAVLASNARWTGTQCCVYLVPAAVNNPGNKELQENANHQLQAMVEILQRDKPALIVINQAKHQLAFRKPGFDYFKYLNKRDAYAALFKQYKETGHIGNFRIFEKQIP